MRVIKDKYVSNNEDIRKVMEEVIEDMESSPLSVTTNINPTPGKERCDFCHQLGPTWDYPCEDFVLDRVVTGYGVLKQTSIGSWLACGECHELIEINDIDTLANRMAEKHLVTNLFKAILLALVNSFLSHRKGEAIKVT